MSKTRGQKTAVVILTLVIVVMMALLVQVTNNPNTQREANKEALVNDATRIAMDAQVWKVKPSSLGGGRDSLRWHGVTLEALGYVTVDLDELYTVFRYGHRVEYKTENGGCILIYPSLDEDTLIVECQSITEDGQLWNRVLAVVTGVTPSDIAIFRL